MIEWNRSNTLIHAQPNCTTCGGQGHKITLRNTPLAPCKCVLRRIFRLCFEKFRYIAMQEPEGSPRKTGPGTWSRMKEEYLADFVLIAKRTLTPEEYQLFRFSFLLGADWKLCTRRLKLNKGNFFHAVYRIEAKLGRAFAETRPYGLYPLDEYFGRARAEVTRITPRDPEPASMALHPPVRPADALPKAA